MQCNIFGFVASIFFKPLAKAIRDGSYQVEMFGNSVKKILAVAFRVQLELRVAAVQQGHVDNHGELEIKMFSVKITFRVSV